MRFHIPYYFIVCQSLLGIFLVKMSCSAPTIIEEHEQARQALTLVREQIDQERLLLAEPLTKAEIDLINLRSSVRLARMGVEARKEEVRQSQEDLKSLENYVTEASDSLKRYHYTRAAFLLPNEEASDWAPAASLMEQVSVLEQGLSRMEGLVGGGVIEGAIAGPEGVLEKGRFFVLGPALWFKSIDGSVMGAVEASAMKGSAEVIIDGVDPSLMLEKEVEVEVDVTGGKARALAAVNQSPVELLRQGGLWIWPIMGIAAISALCGVMKLIQLAQVREPKPIWINEVLVPIREGDLEEAKKLAKVPNHPASGVIHAALGFIASGPDVVEEVIYEQLITVERKMQAWLPFIAITAAIAPLLGLLGTVSGMIRTFNVITVTGTGDAKPLAGGISEALVTTLFGLVVAIPALILHSLLARRSTGIVQMTEKLGLAMVNGLRKQ